MRVLNPLQEVNRLNILSKRAQAAFLTGAEDILIHDPDAYQRIRKLYLDSTMNFTRSLAKDLLGDIEDLFR